MEKTNAILERIAAAVPEARRDLELELSERQLAELAVVPRSTIRLEASGPVRADLIVIVANALTVVELYLGKDLADELLELTRASSEVAS